MTDKAMNRLPRTGEDIPPVQLTEAEILITAHLLELVKHESINVGDRIVESDAFRYVITQAEWDAASSALVKLYDTGFAGPF
jgi:hypothetical protein